MDQPSSTESNAITLRIRFKSASLDEFIGRYGADVSPGGIFIRTKQPVEVGTTLQFDFSLADGSALLCGTGTVAWVRESDPARANSVPGMGLRFDKLTPESQHTHQVILAEKARKEGKASSTPYPPTAFVAPASRVSPAPDAAKPASEPEPKIQPGPVNLATTRPAPAVLVQPPPPVVAPAAASPSVAGTPSSSLDVDEFSESGKTEVSDKPLDYYLKEAAAKEPLPERGPSLRTAEEAALQSALDDIGGAAPITKSGPPPEGYDLTDSGELAAGEKKPAPAASPQRKSGSREAFASLLNLDAAGKQDERQNAAPSEEVLQEVSAGAPIEETPTEKTEEVASSLGSAPLAGPETLDLGTGLEAGFTEGPPTRNIAPLRKPKGSFKAVAAIAVVAAAAAFGAVYLAKTKPWQEQAKPEAVVASATPSAENPPAAVPPPAKPAVEPAKPADDKQAAAAAKVAAAGEVAKKEEGKPTDKTQAAGDKAAIEKAAAAKPAQGEAGAGRVAGRAGAKASGMALEKPGMAWDQVYRLVVKSAPPSAEVLIDGEYFSRTPCERRILDTTKAFVVIVRKEGYEPHQRVVGPSDNWIKKGEEHVFTVVAKLKRARHPAEFLPPAPSPELRVDKQPEPALFRPASPTPAEPAKPALSKEPAKPESAAAKLEPAKPAAVPAPAKLEPAKPAAAPPAVAPAPAKAEPAKPAPAKAEPAKTEPAAPKVEPAKPTPAKVEPPKPAPAKVEPPKPAPAKVEPAKAEPAKPAAAPAAANPAFKPAPNFDDQGKTKP